MAHLYIPLDGVPIVPSPPTADFIAADGYVVFALSVRQFYAYNQSLGIWQPAGGGIIVADTDSIDLTDTLGTLTADVRISADAAPVGNVKATLTVQSGASPGLLAVVSESDIKALFSVTDTNSVDLTYTSGATSADVRLSANAADVGYQLVPIDVQATGSKGLRAQISNAAIQAALTVTDSNSIDLTYSGGAMSGDVRLSANAADAGYRKVGIDIQSTASVGLRAQIADTAIQGAISVTDTDALDLSYTSGAISGTLFLSAASADAGNQKVNLDIQTGANKGLRAQIPNTAIQSALSVTDTNSLDLTYATGALSGDVRLSANAADASNQKVNLDIQGTGSVGVRAQIPNTSIRAALSVTDTNSVDMTYSAGAFSSDVRLSSNAADAGFTIVGLSVQSTGVVGLRAQVQNTAIQGLFSASAPLSYSAGAFTFDVNTTALTTYLLLTGGTITGQVYTNNGLTGTGTATTCIQPTAPHAVGNLQSTTLTFDVNYSPSYRITLAIANHPAMLIECCRHTAEITILSDQENLYLESDAGTGIYITKSAVSNLVTIKNRLGTTHNIFVLIERGLLTSATAWA